MDDQCKGCDTVKKLNQLLTKNQLLCAPEESENGSLLKISPQSDEAAITEIFENIILGILAVDTETQLFTYANPAACRMLGYHRKKLLELNLSDILFEENLNEILTEFENVKAGLKSQVEVMLRREDGDRLYTHTYATLININGKRQVFGFLTDITKQKILYQKLEDNEQKYRQLYDYAQIPLYRTRISDGKLLECNHAMAYLLGYASKEQCLAEYISASHYASPPKRDELLGRLKEEGFISGFEIEFTRRDGSHAWVEITAKLYPEQGYLEGVQIDITASKVLSKTEKKILDLIRS